MVNSQFQQTFLSKQKVDQVLNRNKVFRRGGKVPDEHGTNHTANFSHN